MKRAAIVGTIALSLSLAGTAHAFCGFYVSGSNTKLFADATSVVLMREGTRTILSMQNDYRGPLEDFAMVVPVPVVLQQEEVKTLPRGVIERVDSLGSPRLVEYWEQNPCPEPQPELELQSMRRATAKPSMKKGKAADDEGEEPVVKIEAQFTVGEYNILILSATEAAGLETWLRQNKYTIPEGAEPLLRPYVESGSKFFVAKVDPKKVALDADGRATLSPLRFHYDSEEFSLPIRLGLVSSSGKQDLIVNIISADKRYEVANYRNVVIPTNFDVKPTVKQRFAEFYAALFDKTLEANPGAVVTEYAWTAQPTPRWRGRGGRGGMGGKCDPCPQNEQGVLMIPMDSDMITLGGDVLGGTPGGARISQGGYVLTRLHARYGKADMKDDLRFKEAKPITGGREVWSRSGLEYGAQPAAQNNFQARYAIRYWWTGPIRCANPQRGVWGGPPSGGNTNVIAAGKSAYAPRGKLALAQVIKRDLWEIGFKKAAAPAPKPAAPAAPKAMWFGGGAFGGLLLIGLVALIARRRRG
jgi:hypothetical protein